MKTDYARNYSDLKNPSSVSGDGAYAEYILPMEKETSFQSLVPKARPFFLICNLQ